MGSVESTFCSPSVTDTYDDEKSNRPDVQMDAVLVTGANAGLGRESCRQLAAQYGAKKIFLGCRNETKAKNAIQQLIEETRAPASTFQFVQMDTTNLDSCRSAVQSIDVPLNGVILNAGGSGPREVEMTADGVTTQFAMNVLGHAVLLEELIDQQKLAVGARIVYAGSELARGLAAFGSEKPTFDEENLMDDMVAWADGTKYDQMLGYGYAKAIAAFYLSHVAALNPDYYFFTVSPGGTSGTNGADHQPLPVWLFIKVIAPLYMMHSLEEGCTRYMAGLGVTNVHEIQPSDSGKFFASIGDTAKGPIGDQGMDHPEFYDVTYQRAAYEAIHRFIQ